MNAWSLLKATAVRKPVQIYAGLSAATVASCYLLAVAFDGSDLGGYILSGGRHAAYSCLAAILASVPAMVFAQRKDTHAREGEQTLKRQQEVIQKLGTQVDDLMRQLTAAKSKAKADFKHLDAVANMAVDDAIKLRDEVKKGQETLAYTLTEAEKLDAREKQARATIRTMEQNEKSREVYVSQLEKKVGDQAILIKTMEAQLAPLNELLSLQQ